MKRPSYHALVLFLLVLPILLGALTLIPGHAEASLFSKGDSNDLYARLGVSRGATKDEIKKAFRKTTREHHPDLQETPEAKEAAKEYMVKVLQAYEVLSDDIQREDYDRYGKIPGEQVNTAGFTAEEIFQYFHQQSPILSKTRQLESLTLLQRILSFRGNRLFLLQVYDDACTSCRWFASTWDGLTESNLVDGGILEMFRIDAYSSEASLLLNALNVSYKGEIQIFAIVDGKVWTMPYLRSIVSSRNERNAFTSLLDFVMSFFYDKYLEVSVFIRENNTQAVLEWLQEDRDDSSGIRVLLPPLRGESIGLALSYVYEDVIVVRSAPREVLLDIVENYCGQKIEVRARGGETIDMPEFIVVSLHQLPLLSKKTTAAATSVENSHVVGNCTGVHVGATAALTYRKANSFLKESLPERYPGMENITHVTSMSFYKLCQQHCLLWLRKNCREPPSDAWEKTLRANYKPFAVGYICLDSEHTLWDVLPTWAQEGLVAIVDGNENTLHAVSSKPEASQIAQALSRLLLGGDEEEEERSIPLEAPLSHLLRSHPFYISTMQYMYITFRWIYSFVQPYVSNIYPVFMMFIMHKILNRFGILGNNNSSYDNNGGGQGATKSATKPTGMNTKTKVGEAGHGNPDNRNKKESEIRPYSAADLESAKDGRGFLLLFFQSDDTKTVTVPSLAKDHRFRLRIASPKDPKWALWLSEQQKQPQGEERDAANNENAATGGEKELTVVAIREGRMMATVKPPHVPMESWLCDILDGTTSVKTPLP